MLLRVFRKQWRVLVSFKLIINNLALYNGSIILGTDEARIIKEVISYNKIQRQVIKEKYFTMYGHVRDFL